MGQHCSAPIDGTCPPQAPGSAQNMVAEESNKTDSTDESTVPSQRHNVKAAMLSQAGDTVSMKEEKSHNKNLKQDVDFGKISIRAAIDTFIENCLSANNDSSPQYPDSSSENEDITPDEPPVNTSSSNACDADTAKGFTNNDHSSRNFDSSQAIFGSHLTCPDLNHGSKIQAENLVINETVKQESFSNGQKSISEREYREQRSECNADQTMNLKVEMDVGDDKSCSQPVPEADLAVFSQKNECAQGNSEKNLCEEPATSATLKKKSFSAFLEERFKTVDSHKCEELNRLAMNADVQCQSHILMWEISQKPAESGLHVQNGPVLSSVPVRLQTVIDHVLDNSLRNLDQLSAESSNKRPGVTPEVQVINRPSGQLSPPEVMPNDQKKPQEKSVTDLTSKPNLCLKDHIERVLLEAIKEDERQEALNIERERSKTAAEKVTDKKGESDVSIIDVSKGKSNSSCETDNKRLHKDKAKCAKDSHVSVQDLVDHMINQTTVINKHSMPSTVPLLSELRLASSQTDNTGPSHDSTKQPYTSRYNSNTGKAITETPGNQQNLQTSVKVGRKRGRPPGRSTNSAKRDKSEPARELNLHSGQLTNQTQGRILNHFQTPVSVNLPYLIESGATGGPTSALFQQRSPYETEKLPPPLWKKGNQSVTTSPTSQQNLPYSFISPLHPQEQQQHRGHLSSGQTHNLQPVTTGSGHISSSPIVHDQAKENMPNNNQHVPVSPSPTKYAPSPSYISRHSQRMSPSHSPILLHSASKQGSTGELPQHSSLYHLYPASNVASISKDVVNKDTPHDHHYRPYSAPSKTLSDLPLVVTKIRTLNDLHYPPSKSEPHSPARPGFEPTHLDPNTTLLSAQRQNEDVVQRSPVAHGQHKHYNQHYNLPESYQQHPGHMLLVSKLSSSLRSQDNQTHQLNNSEIVHPMTRDVTSTQGNQRFHQGMSTAQDDQPLDLSLKLSPVKGWDTRARDQSKQDTELRARRSPYRLVAKALNDQDRDLELEQQGTNGLQSLEKSVDRLLHFRHPQPQPLQPAYLAKPHCPQQRQRMPSLLEAYHGDGLSEYPTGYRSNSNDSNVLHTAAHQSHSQYQLYQTFSQSQESDSHTISQAHISYCDRHQQPLQSHESYIRQQSYRHSQESCSQRRDSMPQPQSEPKPQEKLLSYTHSPSNKGTSQHLGQSSVIFVHPTDRSQKSPPGSITKPTRGQYSSRSVDVAQQQASSAQAFQCFSDQSSNRKQTSPVENKLLVGFQQPSNYHSEFGEVMPSSLVTVQKRDMSPYLMSENKDNLISASETRGTHSPNRLSKISPKPISNITGVLSQSPVLETKEPQSSTDFLKIKDTLPKISDFDAPQNHKHDLSPDMTSDPSTSETVQFICPLCRQTYISLYDFRKHSLNQHGLEPQGDHRVSQASSASKIILPPAQCLETNEKLYLLSLEPSDIPKQKVHSQSTQDKGCHAGDLHKQGLSTRCILGDIKTLPSSYVSLSTISNEGSEQIVVKELPKTTKSLDCSECGQAFHLNDFASYKKHCRQHGLHQASNVELFIHPEYGNGFFEPKQDHLTTPSSLTSCVCEICGMLFSHSNDSLNSHLQKVHGILSESEQNCTGNILQEGKESSAPRHLSASPISESLVTIPASTLRQHLTLSQPQQSAAASSHPQQSATTSSQLQKSATALSQSQQSATTTSQPHQSATMFSPVSVSTSPPVSVPTSPSAILVKQISPLAKRHHAPPSMDLHLLTVHTPKGLEIQKLPADAVVTSASPDSSFDDKKLVCDPLVETSTSQREAISSIQEVTKSSKSVGEKGNSFCQEMVSSNAGNDLGNKDVTNDNNSNNIMYKKCDNISVNKYDKTCGDISHSSSHNKFDTNNETDLDSSDKRTSADSESQPLGALAAPCSAVEEADIDKDYYKHKKYHRLKKRVTSCNLDIEPETKSQKLEEYVAQ